MAAPRPHRLVLLLLLVLVAPACTTVRRQDPAGTRAVDLALPPLWWSSSSPDGRSASWWTLFGLVGGDREDDRGSTRALPLWWSAHDGGAGVETTLLVPFWYERTSPDESIRWYGPLYRRTSTPEWTSHHLLVDVVDWGGDPEGQRGRSGTMLLWDHADHGGGRHDLTLVPVLGLAKLAAFQWGFPAEGVTVGALDRQASRRMTLVDVLNIVHLFGYDDVGDTREVRLLTLFGNEVLSLARSWEARDDGPFRREWLFPLWFDVADEGWRWRALGPLWGAIEDEAAGTATDWWLLGLVSRTEAAAGDTWRLCGLPILGP